MEEPIGNDDHHIGDGFHRRNLRPVAGFPGQTSFRFLCHVSTIGAVIGRSGAIVKQLERDTGAKIRVNGVVPDCAERLITVLGSDACDRRFTLAGEEEREECEVSQAQEALLMVYGRASEAEPWMEPGAGGGNGRCCCRLLADSGQVGAVMGKGGKTIEKMRNDSGARIRILPQDQIPRCAAPGDELIQIMGSIMAVKKAVVIVSRCLQECPPFYRAPMLVNRPTEDASYGNFPDPHVEFLPRYDSSSPSMPRNPIDYASGGPSLSTDFDRITSLRTKNERREVVFRLLSSNGAVGGVIGKGGSIIKALQNETGASITVAAPVSGSNRRVVTVSAFENAESSFSPAQNALVRVFTRSVEASIENGFISSLNDRVSVTAKLLVTSNQGSCLIGKGGAVVSEIRKTSGAEVQILGGDQVPNCALEHDEVVQIIGDYDNVRDALFQVTRTLRDGIFSGLSPYFDKEGVLTRGMNHLVLNQKIGASPSRLQTSQTMGRGNVKPPTDNGRGLTTFGGVLEVENESISATKMNTTVEILVSADQLGSVYGEDGSNLARLRQISGAEVDVKDGNLSESEGKVTISGTADQTRAAQSLLQAFLLIA